MEPIESFEKTGGLEERAAVGAAAAPDSDTNLAALVVALASLPEAERKAVAEHVAALAKLTPSKRAAILTLARE